MTGSQITDADGVVLAEVAEGLGEATNNVAEYTAVIEGLERAQRARCRQRAAADPIPYLLINQLTRDGTG